MRCVAVAISDADLVRIASVVVVCRNWMMDVRKMPEIIMKMNIATISSTMLTPRSPRRAGNTVRRPAPQPARSPRRIRRTTPLIPASHSLFIVIAPPFPSHVCRLGFCSGIMAPITQSASSRHSRQAPWTWCRCRSCSWSGYPARSRPQPRGSQEHRCWPNRT